MAASKKGFDKEYIFNLIMPTAGAEQPPEEEEELPSPAPQEPLPEEEPDSLALLRAKVNQPAAYSAAVQLPATKKNLVLVNLMEQLVADRLDAVFEKFNCCRCDKCRQDVAALALNALPAHYVVAQPEELPRLLEEAPTKDIAGALVKAILHVKNHPQH